MTWWPINSNVRIIVSSGCLNMSSSGCKSEFFTQKSYTLTFVLYLIVYLFFSVVGSLGNITSIVSTSGSLVIIDLTRIGSIGRLIGCSYRTQVRKASPMSQIRKASKER